LSGGMQFLIGTFWNETRSRFSVPKMDVVNSRNRFSTSPARLILGRPRSFGNVCSDSCGGGGRGQQDDAPPLRCAEMFSNEHADKGRALWTQIGRLPARFRRSVLPKGCGETPATLSNVLFADFTNIILCVCVVCVVCVCVCV